MKTMNARRRLAFVAGIAALAIFGLTGIAHAVQFGSGWTLTGNGRNAVMDVPAVFGTKSAPVVGISDKVLTIWKWDAINQKWAFFTPTMDMADVATYASGKGYSVLKNIFPGEGYWINAKSTVTIPDLAGQVYALNPWQLASGWNLIATGTGVTPAQFSASIAPFSATTVWAWDSSSANWYFYAPSLDAKGGSVLSDYITSKNYLGFGNGSLIDGRGFWVNRTAVSGSPTANLAPLDQAKQMFSELRTTFNSIHNSLDTGALDGQVRSMTADLSNVVMPKAIDVSYRLMALNAGAKLYRDVKAGQTYGYMSIAGTGTPATTTYRTYDNSSGFPPFNANRIPGFAYYSCATNAISTTAPLASVTCFVYRQQALPWVYAYANGASLPYYVYDPANLLISKTQKEQYLRLVVTETAVDSYAIAATAREQTSGFTYSSTGVGTYMTPTFAQIGTMTYTGTYQITRDASGVLQAAALAVDMPAISSGIDKLTFNINGTRSVQVAGSPNAIYRDALTGLVAGVNAQGATVFSMGLNSGSYLDQVENTLGQPVGIDALKEIKLVGIVQTPGVRFDGTIEAKSVVVDADGLRAVPTDVSFTGRVTDITAGGAGAILNGTVTAAISNFGAFHSTQPVTATNYEHGTVGFNGTLQLPSRPQMGLTLSAQRTGPVTNTLSGQYTYGNGVAITISGTHDSNNSAASSLTFTNQDGVSVTIPDVGDGTISKAGVTLGTIQGGIIYYSDGVFESMN